MKIIYLLLICCGLTVSIAHGQESKSNYLEQVQTLDTTLETLYGVISGEKGEARNWELFRFLFNPNARLIPSEKNEEGGYGLRYMTPDDYISSSGKWLVDNGFFETEIHRSVQTFGSLTHVLSTYESFRSRSDTQPFMRGINSIQLLHDGQRWWIVNIYWTQETPEHSIPAEFLPKQ